MFDRRWLVALVLLAGWAIASSHGLLALSAGLGLLSALSLRISRYYCLHGVSYERSLAKSRALLGESVELTTRFTNRKLMPLTLLEIEDTLPRHVRVSGGHVRATRATLLPCIYLARAMLPYERITRRFQVRCERRGLHVFGPAELHAGDYLGAAIRHRALPETSELLVLPKVFPLAFAQLRSELLIGSTGAPRQLLPDPVRAVGARDYRPGDPLRAIDWRASARRAALMVRELEPSTRPALQVILNFRIAAPAADGVEPDELEFAISVAASLAAHACRRGFRVGLAGNGLSAGAPLHVPASSAPTQLARVLEALARAAPRPRCALAELLVDSRLRAAGSTIVVTEHVDERALAPLLELQRRGRALLVVLTARAEQACALGPLRTLRVPYRAGWAEHDALAITS